MAWTTPRTWVAGEIVTAALMNTHIKDDLRYLKGLDGVPTVESGLIIDNAGGDEYLQIPSLTTTERDALTPVNGMIIYNETTTEFNKYENAGWKDLGGGVDHGGLDGLTDDDHTQYQKESLLTTAGDIAYATASSAWARLGIGTALQYLRTNAGATAPEWAAGPLVTKILSHTRTNSAATGDVAYTGYGFQPKALIIFANRSTVDISLGIGDSSLAEMCVYMNELSQWLLDATNIIYINTGATPDYQKAVLKTLDADGFTLTWTKAGTPAGTTTFIVLAIA